MAVVGTVVVCPVVVCPVVCTFVRTLVAKARMSFVSADPQVPAALRWWFVVHFVADIVFAVPLIVAPVAFGTLVGHDAIDPLTARMVGAALVGIGVESLLGRNDQRASFLTMLRLKVLWSSTACAGLLLGLLTGGPVVVTALLLATFAGFCGLWSFWFVRVRRARD